MKPAWFVLTIIGKDRPGIIAKVTEVLYRLGANLEDVSMTILEGQFAMILVACLQTPHKQIEIQKILRKLETREHLTFFWKDLQGRLSRGERHVKGSDSYLISAIGRDRTGIVYQISRLLASQGLNITDLNSRILGRKGRAVYAMLLEVDISRRFPMRKLQRALSTLHRKLGIEIRIKPVERIEV